MLQPSLVHRHVNAGQVIEASVGATCVDEVTEHVGADGRRFTHRRYVDEDACVRGELWILHEAAHLWSGGSTGGSFADPLGPAASEEMLRFFQGHRRTRSRIADSEQTPVLKIAR